MKKLILIAFVFLSTFSNSQNVEGDWYGDLKIPMRNITLKLSLTDKAKELTIKEGKAYTFTIDSVYKNGSEFVFYVKTNNVKYEGVIKEDSIIGKWIQNGIVLPANFSRNKIKPVVSKRPQTPKSPFDYYTEEITVENKMANLNLSGTLTLPAKGDKTYPVVLLIAGSGPSNRDSEILGHKSFAVIADHLAKQGIGSFRYDERGVGKSTGKYAGSDLNDFYSDIEVLVQYLKKRKEVGKLGLIGHSEGGILAPWYASEHKKEIDFVVMMAGPGLPLAEVMHNQRRNLNEIVGMSEKSILENRKMFEKIDYAVLNSSSQEEKVAKIKEIVRAKFTKEEADEMIINSAIQEILAFVDRPWYNSFIVINPKDYLKKIKCPVLAMGGGKDLQVDSESNLKAISESLNSKRFCRVDNTILTFGNLNHLFQPCETGNVDEYAKIETTIDREALFAISEWINELK